MARFPYLKCALIAFLLGSSTINAQNWTVGTPVNRTIIDYPARITVTSFCDSLNPVNGQDAEWVIALPAVTGVAYYLHVDDATSPLHAYKFRQGTNVLVMSLGDSMLLASTGPTDTVHVGYAGFQSEVSVRFKAIGTPALAGELHPCGSTNDGWWNQPIGCLDRNWPDSQTYLVDCLVQGATGTSPADLPSIQAWPLPAHHSLHVSMSHDATHYQLYDALMRCVRTMHAAPGEQVISVEGLPSGTYFLVATDPLGNNIACRRVVLH